jgi:hypothetical protein
MEFVLIKTKNGRSYCRAIVKGFQKKSPESEVRSPENQSLQLHSLTGMALRTPGDMQTTWLTRIASPG